MSYAPPPDPELNPYSAPKSELILDDVGSPSAFVGYAGFWRRFAAFFLDQILTTIIATIIQFGVGLVIGIAGAASGNAEAVQGDSMQVIATILGFGIGLIVPLIYFTLMESSSSQATLGKMALGIKVVDYDGRRISFGKALGRYLGKIVSGIILSIGYIMAAFTERKQALHDMMAGTLVVKVR